MSKYDDFLDEFYALLKKYDYKAKATLDGVEIKNGFEFIKKQSLSYDPFLDETDKNEEFIIVGLYDTSLKSRLPNGEVVIEQKPILNILHNLISK